MKGCCAIYWPPQLLRKKYWQVHGVLLFLLTLPLFGFSCEDPCEDCLAESSTISVCCAPPGESGQCPCDCHAGTWDLRIYGADQSTLLARTVVVLASSDPVTCVEFDVPPCSKVFVEAYFRCDAPPDPETGNDCSPNKVFGPDIHEINTGCGQYIQVDVKYCFQMVRTKRSDSESR